MFFFKKLNLYLKLIKIPKKIYIGVIISLKFFKERHKNIQEWLNLK